MDESRARSYIYPIHLTIVDISQMEAIYCTITVMISNIVIGVPCLSSSQNTSLYLPTYISSPSGAVDPLTGERYASFDSRIMRVFDPFSASQLVECVSPGASDQTSDHHRNEIDFIFERETYQGYANHSFKYIYHQEQPIRLAIQNREQYSDPFAISYQFVLPHTAPDSFDLDPYAGIIHYFPRPGMNSSTRYSLVVLARYHTFITLARLNIILHPQQTHHPRTSYRFPLVTPSVHNYTLGYLDAREGNWTILSPEIGTMFEIDDHGRLFVANQTLISAEEKHLYAFFVQDQFFRFIRVEIIPQVKRLVQCVLNRFSSLDDGELLIGFVEMVQTKYSIGSAYDSLSRHSFSLLNYHYLLELDREHGLLSYRHSPRTMLKSIELLVEIGNARCLIELNDVARISYLMIRNGSQLHAQLQHQIRFAKVK